MHETKEGTPLTPQQRRQAVATILAAGILRCRRIAKLTADPGTRKSKDCQPNCLEASRTKRPHAPTGSGGYDPRDPEKGRMA